MTKRLRHLAFATVLGAALLPALPAHAADPPKNRWLDTRLALCDATACYFAWGALDSDGDGVSNADELAARTDPYDPDSRPGLRHIVELGGARGLPTFENGMGSFLLVPAEVLALRDRAGLDVAAGAFPLPTRGDALSRLGIDSKTLDGLGISLERDGLTVGLGGLREGDQLPPTRAGTISAGSVNTINPIGPGSANAVNNGGVKSYHANSDDTVITVEYRNGSSATQRETRPGVFRTEWTSPSGTMVQVVTTRESAREERNGATDVTTETVYEDGDGNVLAKVVTTTHTGANGSKSTHTVATTYQYQDGKHTGTTVKTTEGADDGKGGTTESSSTQKCDANGENCTGAGTDSGNGSEEGDYPEDDGGTAVGYWDTEGSDVAYVSQELLAGVLKVRGATITTMQGWTPPGLEGQPKSTRDPSTIALYDGDQLSGSFTMTDPFRVTRAQPEFHPGLPDPVRGTPPSTGGCNGLC